MTSIYSALLGLAALGAALCGAWPAAEARPFHHPFGEMREYHRHWLAVCPDAHKPGSEMAYNTNCWASTWTGNEDGSFSGDFPGYRLSVHRNRTTGALSLTFVSVSAEKIDKTRPVRVKFSNGPATDYAYGTSVTPNGNIGNEYTFPIARESQALIRRMKAGNAVTITLPTDKGETSMRFSLIGLRSALGFLKKYAGRHE